MSNWTIRNYNAFIREVRSKNSLTLSQAREVYRQVSNHLGRKVYGVDAAKHPRITGKYVKSALSAQGAGGKGAKSQGARGDSGAQRSDSRRGVEGSGGSGGGVVQVSPPTGGAAPLTITSLSQFYDYWDEDIDYGYDEIESSADYEEAPA